MLGFTRRETWRDFFHPAKLNFSGGSITKSRFGDSGLSLEKSKSSLADIEVPDRLSSSLVKIHRETNVSSHTSSPIKSNSSKLRLCKNSSRVSFRITWCH